MNLITPALKTSVEAGFEDIFDSFSRVNTFTLYKTPQETIVTLNGNYDGNWNVGLPEIEYTEVSQSFPARIWFLDYEQQYKSFFFEGKEFEGARAIRETGQIKIQVKEDGYNFIKDATKAVVFGDQWEITSDVKQQGIFDFKYFIFILRRLK